MAVNISIFVDKTLHLRVLHPWSKSNSFMLSGVGWPTQHNPSRAIVSVCCVLCACVVAGFQRGSFGINSLSGGRGGCSSEGRHNARVKEGTEGCRPGRVGGSPASGKPQVKTNWGHQSWGSQKIAFIFFLPLRIPLFPLLGSLPPGSPSLDRPKISL